MEIPGTKEAFSDETEANTVDGLAVKVAQLQRFLLISVPGGFLSDFLLGLGNHFKIGPLFNIIVLCLGLSILGFTIACVYELSLSIGKNRYLWTATMFLPLINLISLILLAHKATTFLRSRGIEVGLFGAKF